MSTPANPPSEAAMLTEARAEVVQADHKATLVLTALGVGGGALLGGVLAGDWEPADYHAPGELIWWMAAVTTAAAITVAACAVWPRWPRDSNTTAIYYWGHVARYDTVVDLANALDNQAATTDDRSRHQLYHLSHIVHRKYSLIRGAMVLVAVAAALFVVAGITG